MSQHLCLARLTPSNLGEDPAGVATIVIVLVFPCPALVVANTVRVVGGKEHTIVADVDDLVRGLARASIRAILLNEPLCVATVVVAAVLLHPQTPVVVAIKSLLNRAHGLRDLGTLASACTHSQVCMHACLHVRMNMHVDV